MRDDITYVLIDTLHYQLSHYALQKSQERFPLRNTLIFSDNPREWGGHGIIQIPEIKTTADYNKVIFYELPKYLKTDFALVMQYDGFVLSGACFSERFLDYDYVGAPWPHHQNFCVGNGGFSLRSRKLICSLGEFLHYGDLHRAEDVVICRYLRARLEDALCIEFASSEMAQSFSYEMKGPEQPTFGFHGIFNLPKVMIDDIEILFEHLNPKSVVRMFRAFSNSCEILPIEKRELFYEYCKRHSADLISYAEANARQQVT